MTTHYAAQGTVGVITALAFFTGTEVGLQGYAALNQIGTAAFSGFVSAYFNTREISPLVAGIALAATVGCLMPGRFFLGVGTGENLNEHILGDKGPEHEVRAEMLEESLEVIRLLWEGQQASYQGAYYTVENAPNNPKPLQPRVPIWIGGRGEKRTLRAAARYADGWNAPYIGPDEWTHKSRVLTEWCEKEGRDARSILRDEVSSRARRSDARS
jgi:alkanesulfonate monooxygenase SsuD/methylene tetrahydromethanopterin reductase-like flavin-dependent oxidoreductase (luciferase family)